MTKRFSPYFMSDDLEAQSSLKDVKNKQKHRDPQPQQKNKRCLLMHATSLFRLVFFTTNVLTSYQLFRNYFSFEHHNCIHDLYLLE